MNILRVILSVLLFSLAACQENIELDSQKPSRNNEEANALHLNVNIVGPLSRAVNLGSTFLAGSEIGLSFHSEYFPDYNGKTYNNIKYTAQSTQPDLSWIAQNDITLSTEKGCAAAYFPYDQSVTDITAIPVHAGADKDYMYSGLVSCININKNNVDLQMKHALACIDIEIKKGLYFGTGNISSIEIASESFGSSGLLNAETGELSQVKGLNEYIQFPTDITASSTPTHVYCMVVPDKSAVDKPIYVKATIDDVVYSTTISLAGALLPGNLYNCQLSFSQPIDSKKYIIDIDITSGSVFYSNVMGFTGTIDWGDGTVTTHKDEDHPSHTYRSASYTVTHEGTCSALSFLSKKSSAACVTAIREIGGGLGITDMERAFAKCSRLISLDPAILDELTQVTNFSCAFLECTALSGESPYTLINGKKVHLYERTNYTTYFKSPTSYSNCFYECKSLDDYLTMPGSWTRNGTPDPDGEIVLPGGDGEIIISNH